jgi:hypothetical protein
MAPFNCVSHFEVGIRPLPGVTGYNSIVHVLRNADNKVVIGVPFRAMIEKMDCEKISISAFDVQIPRVNEQERDLISIARPI